MSEERASKAVLEWIEGAYRGLHLPNTGQKPPTVQARGSVTLLMYKSECSLPRISSPSKQRTPERSAFLSLLHPLIFTVSPSSSLLLNVEIMRSSHHYTPQLHECVTVWPVTQNNGHLLRLLKPCRGPVIWKGEEIS